MSIKQNKYSKHLFFMKLALMQAQKNLGNTKENPSVGCVIVNNDYIISSGCTSINGRPHAEMNTISFSKENIKNSNLYVTLEPCSHYGKTPPCVDLIIKNKIKRVFFSIKDPDIRSFNKSTKKLKKNKISVKNNILSSEVKNFYRSYYKFKESNLPFVTAKIAISRDFFTNNKKSKWITNIFSRGRVHIMRSNHDCILTGSKTIISDNPRFTCRINGLEKRSPSIIILDQNLKIPTTSRVISLPRKHRIIIFFNKINKKRIEALNKFKVKLIRAPISNDGNFDLKNILRKIKHLGFSRIFLETGLKLTTSFLNDDIIDDFKLFISNKKVGKNGNNSFKKNMRLFFDNKKFINEKLNLFGDKLISYRMK